MQNIHVIRAAQLVYFPMVRAAGMLLTHTRGAATVHPHSQLCLLVQHLLHTLIYLQPAHAQKTQLALMQNILVLVAAQMEKALMVSIAGMLFTQRKSAATRNFKMLQYP